MNDICFDTVHVVISFLPCYEKLVFKQVGKVFVDLVDCKQVKYKNLCACETHFDKCDIANVIYVLKHNYSQKIKPSVIHFENTNQIEIAKPHLTDFGEIQNFCCGGKGVVYKNVFKISSLRNEL